MTSDQIIPEKNLFASDLGWPVGRYPVLVRDEGTEYGSVVVVRHKPGEILGWRYRSADGTKTLFVFND